MAQYVATEIPFGGRDFGAVFKEIIRKDPTVPKAIGAPSMFVFTSKGKKVYAGPDRPTGVTVDDVKKWLTEGIEQNGPAPSPASKKSEPVRVWKSKSGKHTVQAALVSFDGKTAQLKTTDGRVIEVDVSLLSPEDQQHLKNLAEPAKSKSD